MINTGTKKLLRIIIMAGLFSIVLSFILVPVYNETGTQSLC